VGACTRRWSFSSCREIRSMLLSFGACLWRSAFSVCPIHSARVFDAAAGRRAPQWAALGGGHPAQAVHGAISGGQLWTPHGPLAQIARGWSGNQQARPTGFLALHPSCQVVYRLCATQTGNLLLRFIHLARLSTGYVRLKQVICPCASSTLPGCLPAMCNSNR
jgi:hypothetical protein